MGVVRAIDARERTGVATFTALALGVGDALNADGASELTMRGVVVHGAVTIVRAAEATGSRHRIASVTLGARAVGGSNTFDAMGSDRVAAQVAVTIGVGGASRTGT